jgi:hypothetical protein
MEDHKKTIVHFEEYHYEAQENDSDEEYKDNNICENIIDLFHDLKSRFPYFLGDRVERLYEFILTKKLKRCLIPKSYIKENKKELDVTFNILNKFLTNYKYSIIKESDWMQFCYNESLII